jgi:hypothetical protein
LRLDNLVKLQRSFQKGYKSSSNRKFYIMCVLEGPCTKTEREFQNQNSFNTSRFQMLTLLAHEHYYNPGAGVVSLQARYRMWDPSRSSSTL